MKRESEILQVLTEAPGREFYVSIRSGGYVTDHLHNILAGPYEEDEYQPLIDAGKLVESKLFCSVYLLPKK